MLHPFHDADEIVMHPARHLAHKARTFFKLEASGGILLVFSAILALIVANTPMYVWYDYFLNRVDFSIGFVNSTGLDFTLEKSVLHWINDGLMAIFFLLVGLEIKREIVEGELSSRERAVLPALAAVGGMIVPALIYVYLNYNHPENMGGWAIPAATDIAFALGVLTLLGSRAPMSLKILLTAIAIIDDLGAILIIALFYTADLHVEVLYLALACLALMVALNIKQVTNVAPYIILGTILWIAVLKSGVHATLAGVILAFCIPLKDAKNPTFSPLKHMEHTLHPWIAFGVLPIFAFANAGVPFHDITIQSFADPVTLGIALGLLLGKPLGIFTVAMLTIWAGLSPMPKRTTWYHILAVSVLCGIGFTMSLFIGGLAFEDAGHQASIRLGVLSGSIVAAITGYCMLKFAPCSLCGLPEIDTKQPSSLKEHQI